MGASTGELDEPSPAKVMSGTSVSHDSAHGSLEGGSGSWIAYSSGAGAGGGQTSHPGDGSGEARCHESSADHGSEEGCVGGDSKSSAGQS
jgi:hypothetical protein